VAKLPPLYRPGTERFAGCLRHAGAAGDNARAGEVAERLNAPVLKTGKVATPSGVRIPPSPPKSSRLITGDSNPRSNKAGFEAAGSGPQDRSIPPSPPKSSRLITGDSNPRSNKAGFEAAAVARSPWPGDIDAPRRLSGGLYPVLRHGTAKAQQHTSSPSSAPDAHRRAQPVNLGMSPSAALDHPAVPVASTGGSESG
jgi:hypothetical protein